MFVLARCNKLNICPMWYIACIQILLVEVTLKKIYYSKLKFTIVVTGIFQFTMVNFTLVNFHDYRGKNKDDPSPITIWLPKKIGGYISSLSKLCLFFDSFS